jgi:hypothetical protein
VRPVDVILGLPDNVLRGLDAGAFVRDGGVVREAANGRIVALLRDADVADSPLRALLESNVVPLALQGLSMAALERRLARIEGLVRRGLDALAADLALANLRLDAGMVGELLGNLQACALDLAAGRGERVPEYRRSLLIAYQRLRLLAAAAASDPRVLRAHPDALQQAARAALVAGVAARDLTLRLGETDAGLQLTDALSQEWNGIHERVRAALSTLRALFWIEAPHRAAAGELHESARRLEGHREMARLLPGVSHARRLGP